MSEETQKIEEPKVLSKHDFYFETPLYETIVLEELDTDTFDGDVDAYSAKNSTDTTYNVNRSEIDTWSHLYEGDHYSTTVGFFLVTLTCKRKDNDELRFFIYKDKDIVVKVGQDPSLADLQFAEIGKKYDKVLPDEDLKNFKKAIGLAAHGAGAGSFVYLRRIFENLISETFTDNASLVSVKEADFKTTRMEDKVELLKKFLPSQLVEMKAIYKIFGKGVHELSEEECRRYFGPLKLSIELILDQKIKERKEKERDADVKKQLQEIQQELSHKENGNKS